MSITRKTCDFPSYLRSCDLEKHVSRSLHAKELARDPDHIVIPQRAGGTRRVEEVRTDKTLEGRRKIDVGRRFFLDRL